MGVNSPTGAIPGANPGVVVGSPVATGAGEPQLGVIEGGLLSADVGRSLSDGDRNIALQAEYEALEYGRAGQPTGWSNPRSGNRGRVVVGATYEVNRLDCREYHHRIEIGGRARVVEGTACRQPNGVWRIVG
jgi:surface antigen